MLSIKNEAELNKLGLKIHSSDPTKAVSLIQPSDALPNEGWTLEQLGQFALTSVAESKRLHADASCLARKSTVQVFWAGSALTYAKSKVKDVGQKWSEWLRKRHIPRTTAWEAMELFAEAKTVDAIANLTLTQAKRKFKVTKPPKSQPKEKVASAKKRSTKKIAAPKEPRNPELRIVTNDEPDDNTPPSPVIPIRPLDALVKIRDYLGNLLDDPDQDWKEESATEYQTVIDECIELLQRIGKECGQ